jgi:hypothetical protein
MVKKVISGEKPSEGVENPNIELDSLSNTSLENIGKEKIESLKVVVDEIQNLISEREKLSGDVINDAEKEKRAIDNFMLDVEAKMEAGDIEGERERIALRQKRVDVSELQLHERISAWQDIARLKQELRERQQELREKLGRMEMFGKLLEE